jgi:hypothetical protein
MLLLNSCRGANRRPNSTQIPQVDDSNKNGRASTAKLKKVALGFAPASNTKPRSRVLTLLLHPRFRTMRQVFHSAVPTMKRRQTGEIDVAITVRVSTVDACSLARTIQVAMISQLQLLFAVSLLGMAPTACLVLRPRQPAAQVGEPRYL